MHDLINTLNDKRIQLEGAINTLPAEEKYTTLKNEGKTLVQKMKQWDEDMVQRKSKAYDDVENFPNKFTANYLFMLNHTESDIPKVTKPTKDRLAELTADWAKLKSRADEILGKDIPAINKQLWNSGIGAVWKR